MPILTFIIIMVCKDELVMLSAKEDSKKGINLEWI